VLRYKSVEKELSGYEAHTTNNRMELTAVIEAVKAIRGSCRLRVYTDSSYLKDGITKWIKTWQRNGWRTSSREPVKNKDLWEKLVEVSGRHEVEWHWVRGHAGHPENERCDRLARAAIEQHLRR
jgi:ribonuclease HI